MRDFSSTRTKLTGKRRALLQALLEDEGIRLPETSTIKRANRQESAPLSFAQRRMWFLDQLQPNNPFYNMFESFHLKGQLSVAALEQSYNELLKRHTILRTIFVVIRDEPAQVVQEYTWTPIAQIDLRSWSSQEHNIILHDLATKEAEGPFILDQGPLLRIKLISLHQEEHVLLLTMHHSIADGWSTTILGRELATHYRTFSEGKPPSFAELPIQYSDYAYWQQEWLHNKQFRTQLDYWKQQLSGAPTVLELPTDYPRPSVQHYRGKQILFTLPPPLLTQLKAACVREEVTSFMWLLAVFQIVLYRYTQQEDILVGTPIAGRMYPELEELIGYFANTLVLRTKLYRTQTFLELLKHIKEVTLDAFTHQEMPFEKLVEELHIERSLSHNPLFQVMFVMQNIPASPLTLPGLEVQSRCLSEHQTARFDLTLAFEEDGQELIGSVEYATDLFASATTERFIGHLRMLLTQTLTHPEQRIADLQLLTNQEYRDAVGRAPLAGALLGETLAGEILLVEERDISPSRAPARGARPTMHGMFEEQVARTPDAVALIGSQHTLTYQHLDAQANQLAHFLHHLQVGPEVPVAVCLERSPALLVCLLAILKAGGCYVPVDPRTPPLRLARMLEDTHAPLLLTQRSLLPSLPSLHARILCLEEVHASLAHFPAAVPPSIDVRPDNLAYIIFTSGSTGQPKGVQIIHAAVCNLLVDMQRLLSLNNNSVFAAVASFAFDMSIPELFLPLITGAQEVLFNQEVALEPRQFLALLQQYEITCIQATPTMWSLLLEAGLLNSHPSFTCISGAEALPWEVATQLLQTGCPLYNFYGPTETTVWSMQHQIHGEDAQVLIGRPLANTQVYILDPCWQPVPVGILGEVYIGGSGLARGYLNQPATTAEHFIPHPFSSQPGARLYKTGDLARHRCDGTIEYRGRCDRQIKLRGFRIELGEIEKVLRQHPTIRDAVVLVRGDQPDKKQLVAYLVLKTEETFHSDQISRFLREHVPEYMLPAAYVPLTALPLTTHGKINYGALPSPAMQRPELQRHLVAPRDALELQLVQIWQETLAVVPIGITDNFFDLGGNSFSAVRLMAHIQHTYHHSFPLSLLFQEGTIEVLAQKIRQRFQQMHYSPVVALQQGNGRRPLFCIHPGGGNVLCYRELVHHLGTEQLVYGIEDLRLFLDEGVPTFSCIEEMADFYVRSIRTVQPEGPYLLSGWSFGGLVAFEMARQLHQQKQHVALLALFDTYSPPLLKQIIVDDDGLALARLIQQQVRRTGKGLAPIQEPLDKVENDAQLHAILQQIQQEQQALPAIVLPWIQRFLQHTQADKLMIQNYQPGLYDGQITLFRAADRVKSLPASLDTMYHQAMYGWDVYSTEPVKVYTVPGTHDTLMSQPTIQVVAAQLRQSIDCLAL